MLNIEKVISELVPSQFPEFYKTEGPNFIAFLQAYYEWMETQGQPLNIARNLPEYSYIDTTLNNFIVHFQNTYLKGLEYITHTDKTIVIKHITDLYRTKGTPRAIELLFRIIYGEDITVYLPSSDIFKLSDNKYVIPHYIEVSSHHILPSLVGQTIIGIESGATAYVDSLIRRQINSQYQDILYISNINNQFITNERIQNIANSNVIDVPTITGSLSTLKITEGGSNFVVGEVVDLISQNGIGGKAIVQSVSDISGIVSFQLIDGGYGFTPTSNVYVSTEVINLTNVNSTNILSKFSPFGILEQITFYGNNTVANATANVVGVSSNTVLLVGNVSGTFQLNETVSIGNNASGYVTSITSNNTVTTLYLQNTVNVILSNSNILGTTSNATGTLQSYNVSVGITNLSSGVDPNTYPYVIGNTYGTTATFASGNFGLNASVNIGSIAYTDSFYYNTDYLSSNNVVGVPFIDIVLDGSNSNLASNGYGFPKNPAANLNSTLGSSLNYVYENSGYITSLTGINPGQNYSYAPFVLFYNHDIVRMQLQDYNIYLSDSSQAYYVGEIVTQNIQLTDAYGLVVANSSIFSPFTEVYQSNGSANLAVGAVTQVGSNSITVQTISGSFVASNTYLLYGSNTQYINSVSITKTPTGYNNSDYIVISNGIYNAYANIVTNSTGGFSSGNVTFSNTGSFYSNQYSLLVNTAILAANGHTSNGSGANITPIFSQQLQTTNILSVNSANYYATAVGSVISQTGDRLHVKRLSASESFKEGLNIFGSFSGANSNVFAVNAYSNSIYSGENAYVNTFVYVANGSVTDLKIIDDGFAYANTETLTFISESNSSHFGLAEVFTGNGIGTGIGYFNGTNSFLSSNKYLQDGDFYQDFSYQIKSSLNFDMYADVVKKVVHVAGIKMFGGIYKVSESNATSFSSQTNITIS